MLIYIRAVFTEHKTLTEENFNKFDKLQSVHQNFPTSLLSHYAWNLQFIKLFDMLDSLNLFCRIAELRLNFFGNFENF